MSFSTTFDRDREGPDERFVIPFAVSDGPDSVFKYMKQCPQYKSLTSNEQKTMMYLSHKNFLQFQLDINFPYECIRWFNNIIIFNIR